MSFLQELTLITASSDGADWNPASDMQALARVWRDGQKKDCASLSSPSSPSPSYASLTWLLSVVLQASCTASSQRAPSRRRVRRAHLRFDPLSRSTRVNRLTPPPRPPAVFQRQSHKQNLSSVIVDAKEDIERHYSGDNLRQLFLYNESPCQVRSLSLRPRRHCVDCELTCVRMLFGRPQTHDLFKCKRCKGGKQVARAPAMLYGDTSTCVPLSRSLDVLLLLLRGLTRSSDARRWNHLTNDCLRNIHDSLLRNETGLGAVTACFQCASSLSSVRSSSSSLTLLARRRHFDLSAPPSSRSPSFPPSL